MKKMWLRLLIAWEWWRIKRSPLMRIYLEHRRALEPKP
jgi:hypothetical protein